MEVHLPLVLGVAGLCPGDVNLVNLFALLTPRLNQRFSTRVLTSNQ